MWLLADEETERLGGGGEAESARHRGGRSESGLAVDTTDAAGFRIFPYGAVGPGKPGVFRAVDGPGVKGLVACLRRGAEVAPQFLANEPQKFVITRKGEIGNAHGRGILLSPRSARDDEREAAIPAGGDEERFQPRIINAVDDAIIAGSEEPVYGCFGKKGYLFVDNDVGVDEAQALGHSGHLGTSDMAVEGGELTVHVGHAYFVEIDQGQSTHAASSECFRRPRTDPADSDDCDVGVAQLRQGCGSIEPGDAGETVKIVGWQVVVQSAVP